MMVLIVNSDNSIFKEGIKIEICETPTDLAYTFAKEFQQISEEVINKRNKINIALSGGNTPRLFFSVLSKEYKNKINWSNINFYWVDERCVHPNDKDSNYGMTYEILLKNVYSSFTSPTMKMENIYRIIGENDPELEAERYSELLKKNISLKNNFPRFDLIILGLGEDGHIASIFPSQMKLLTSDKICEVSTHPVSRQKRITLTGKVLNNSERIIFLITGIGKANIVKNIIDKKKDYQKYPAAHIKPTDGELKWYLDSEAASELNSV